jgi:3-hydroxymyristoyl/3-hydroxydecanoyl-(acyl carrier protein) dehydratase
MLFGRAADGQALNFELEWRDAEVSREAGRERRVYRVHVPADYGYFVGHFPGYPILPGAAQLSDLVLPCVRRARPELGPLALMTRVKFLDRIKPDQNVEVVLTWREAEPNLEFALRRADTLCATGKLGFAAVPP